MKQKCPNCKSIDFEVNYTDIGDTDMVRGCNCHKCGAYFIQTFKLVRQELKEIQEQHPQTGTTTPAEAQDLMFKQLNGGVTK